MIIKQTNPNGSTIEYDAPAGASVVKLLSAGTFKNDGGPVRVTIECASGRAWSYEEAQQ